jgi:putative transcriptional regulator
MRKKDFDELLQGVREMKAILGGEMKPAYERVVRPLDIKAIRKRLGLSQGDFALLIRVPTATLRNWEQGRTQPDGPARALLTVAARNPRAVMKALYPSPLRKRA